MWTCSMREPHGSHPDGPIWVAAKELKSLIVAIHPYYGASDHISHKLFTT